MIVFIFGPSGAGKSTLGKWLEQDAGLLHLEIDRFPEGDGIDAANLRAEWDTYLNSRIPRPLVDALQSRIAAQPQEGAVLTFPSCLVLNQDQLDILTHAGITNVILYGTASECLDSFVTNEKTHPRLAGNDPVGHWINNNKDAYITFSRPEYAAFRLATFKKGRHRPRAELVAEIRRRSHA